MSNFGNDWNEILNCVKSEVTPVSFETWFLPLVPVKHDVELNIIYLRTEEEFIVKILKDRYMDILEKSTETVLGKPCKVIINTNDEFEETQSKEAADTSEIKKLDYFPEEFILNPNYNFENFVVGNNNRYANAAALAVAENPAEAYNPLFIYGGSGLGKTHLMHAIGHFILKNHPDLKVLYVSSEMFTNELVRALREKNKTNGGIKAFKKKYRDVDVLLIDDIQFIQGKDSTEIEFFHTFNTLYSLNKQIIISSDRPPNKLELLDERLRSRFSWNLVADIQPPEYETRVAILIKHAELENIPIDDDVMEVIELIAEKIKFNVRELQGAFSRVVSFSVILKDKINVKFARKILKDIFSDNESAITPDTIKKIVCKKYDIKIADIESSKRARSFTLPRQIAMYLCRELTNESYPNIGKSFGKRDHSTVHHACEKIKKDILKNDALRDSINDIKETINNSIN